jgi:hypothetical protein
LNPNTEPLIGLKKHGRILSPYAFHLHDKHQTDARLEECSDKMVQRAIISFSGPDVDKFPTTWYMV